MRRTIFDGSMLRSRVAAPALPDARRHSDTTIVLAGVYGSSTAEAEAEETKRRTKTNARDP
jgi:hypothetical protein